MLALSALHLLAASTASAMPSKSLGMYVLLADDTTEYSSNRSWTPALHPYQQSGANVLFFTFLNPALLPAVPPAFAKLAATRGSGAPGAVSAKAVVLFSIGGESYSTKTNPWPFLASKAAAEAMAIEVAKWSTLYPGCDGVDMDIETGAGAAKGAAANLVHFAAKLHELNPAFIYTQPVFGSPTSVPAANAAIEASFNASWHGGSEPTSLGSVDAIGIMSYSGTGSEAYVEPYAQGCSSKHCTQWYCPLAACVPLGKILLGAGGDATPSTMTALATAVTTQKLGGFMVWFASVLDAATGKTAVRTSFNRRSLPSSRTHSFPPPATVVVRRGGRCLRSWTRREPSGVGRGARRDAASNSGKRSHSFSGRGAHRTRPPRRSAARMETPGGGRGNRLLISHGHAGAAPRKSVGGR
mgnify:FL=1